MDTIKMLDVKDLKYCGTIVSGWIGTCPRCGKGNKEDRKVFAGLKVKRALDNPEARIINCWVACTHCKVSLDWDIRVE